MIFNLKNYIYADASEPWQLYFQDTATPVAEGIVQLHDSVMYYLVLIIVGVSWMIFTILYLFNDKSKKIPYKYASHGTLIEIIWTILPAGVLIAIAYPSFRLLYLLDEVTDPIITLKIIGRQWFWSVEYSDYTFPDNPEGTLSFDSYLLPTDELTEGQLRLLEVDKRIILPTDTHIRLIITAADVLHAWAVPSLGIKVDAVPGRLNQTSMIIKRPGVYYGQCSELCGVQHGFMPIVVEAVSPENYVDFIISQLSPFIEFIEQTIHETKNTKGYVVDKLWDKLLTNPKSLTSRDKSEIVVRVLIGLQQYMKDYESGLQRPLTYYFPEEACKYMFGDVDENAPETNSEDNSFKNNYKENENANN